MFNRLEGETAILRASGVYKVVDLYERDGKLFAAWGGGYIRLAANGTTSKDKVNIDVLALDAPLHRDRFGRLCTGPGEGRKALTGDESAPLLLEKD